jgi:CubicO group peptidase (beta-lactamase class C family)
LARSAPGETGSAAADLPVPESLGGWPALAGEEIRSVGGFDPDALELACARNAQFAAVSHVAIVRHGRLVLEWFENHACPSTRFDIWSCTKSFTSTAYGIWLAQPDCPVTLDTPVYSLIPAGYPLSDPRKERITLCHLLTMTSGIPGHASGIEAIPAATGVGTFEAALGHAPCRARAWSHDRWASKLVFDPGEGWEYSDPAMAHLSLAFVNTTGVELADFVSEHVLEPIGIERLSWDAHGGGPFLGPHTNPESGIHMGARELARFGYLMLHGGRWGERQVVPADWVELATRPSQEHNPSYGYNWWVNAVGAMWWPRVPRDAFAALGFNSNGLYVVPSLDLVVVRLGSGPLEWEERLFLSRVVRAIVD